MHRIKIETFPAAFHITFKMPSHSYPTRFSRVNCSKPKARLRKSRFWISIQGPAIWYNFVANSEKKLNLVLFLHKPLDFENELTFF